MNKILIIYSDLLAIIILSYVNILKFLEVFKYLTLKNTVSMA